MAQVAEIIFREELCADNMATDDRTAHESRETTMFFFSSYQFSLNSFCFPFAVLVLNNFACIRLALNNQRVYKHSESN